MADESYCLDTSAFMNAWNSYYSPLIAAPYWEQIDLLAQQGTIFSPEEVKREIIAKDDELSAWIQDRPYLFREIDEGVQDHLRTIMAAHPKLVDSIKQRSIADPWVIAFAMHYDAIVVTNEVGVGMDGKRIKIPDVCQAFGVKCINEFEFIQRVGISFSAHIG